MVAPRLIEEDCTRLSLQQSSTSQRIISSAKGPATSVYSNRPLALSSIVLGGGVFGAAYNSVDYLSSGTPAKVIETAFENGINAIDTSPFYGASESIIGDALISLRDRFPRSSYHLLTKCGRYGANKWSFDYTPARIRRSVQESLARLHTDYLDAVYLHDVEFIADSCGKANEAGYPLEALDSLEAYGLDDAAAGRVLGEGDQAILDAYRTLLELKEEGLIRRAGIAGYPLPTLLRLARLIEHHLGPVDILQSYSHYNLQNTALKAYIPLMRSAGVGQILSASPFNMGLLTTSGPQDWHLAPPTLRAACLASAGVLSKTCDTTLEAVSLGFGLRSTQGELGCPTVVGCTEVKHVQELLRVWRELWEDLSSKKGDNNVALMKAEKQRKEAVEKQEKNEQLVMVLLRQTGYLDWSWTSPPPFVEPERT